MRLSLLFFLIIYPLIVIVSLFFGIISEIIRKRRCRR